MRTTGERLGVVLLAVRPAYLVVELAVAAAASGYSVLDDSVSELGNLTCTTSCSPGHDAMNAAFVVFGVLLAAGALLLRRPFGPWAAGLLVVSGLSSVATGLAPLDQDAGLHTLAATPLFVAQPVALVLLAVALRAQRPAVARVLLVTGLVVGAAAVGFVVTGSGGLERLALWPVLVAPAFAASGRPATPAASRDR